MSWFRRWWNVLRPSRLQSDLERELAFHVRERAEELGDEREARLVFGNLTSHIESTREMDISGRLEAFLRNLRYAMRSLRKTPGFALTVILTLALGIGANSAVFSAIYGVLLRPLPFPAGDELVKLAQTGARVDQPYVAPLRLEDWNRLNSTLTGVTGYYIQDSSELSGPLPEKLRWAFVAPRFLEVLGVAPALGRDFSPQEEHFGGPAAVLISNRLWRRRFGTDPNVIGKTLRMGSTTTPIVGVMPPAFDFPDRDVDLWSVSAPDAPYAQSRESTWYTVIARLKPGIQIEQARADLARVQSNLGRQFPKSDAKISVAIASLKEATIAGVRKSLWLLFGSVSLLLLIACTNIAALLVSRAAGRRHEISVRYSLGASRTSVVAQLMTEVFLLAVAGAALGLGIAGWSSRVFSVLAGDLPRVNEIGLNWSIVGYSLVCAIAATFACSLIPSIRGTSRSLAGELAHSGRSQVSRRNPGQFVLVAVQVALAVTLLAGAGLLLRSFQELGRVSPGFDPEHVLAFHISTSWGETADPKLKQRVDRILEGLRSIPGIEAAATTYWLPGVPAEHQVELKEFEGRADGEPKMLAQSRAVGPAYFASLGIPLIAGEICRADANHPSVMINRSFANAYLGGTAALGRHLVQPNNSFIHASEISGIVGDVRDNGLHQPPSPTVYWCWGGAQPGTYFIVKTHGDPTAAADAIRRKMRDLEPSRSVYDFAPLTDRISDAYAENRLRTILLAFFAVTAVALACVGLYGTLSYLVKLRQREVALRLALGALRGQVLRQFLAQGLRVSAIGCAAGLGLAAAFTKVLAGMLYGVTPADAVTLGGVVTMMLGVSLAASLLPAIRAARVDPAETLREE